MLYPSILLICPNNAAKKLFDAKLWGTLGATTYNVVCGMCR